MKVLFMNNEKLLVKASITVIDNILTVTNSPTLVILA